MNKLLVLIMVFAFTPLAFAASSETSGGGMLDSLDLTEAQQAEIAEIRADGGSGREIHAVLTPEQHKQAKEWRKRNGKGAQKRLKHLKTNLDLSDDQESQVKAILASGGSGKEIRAVLTDEQRLKFEAMPKKGKHKGKHKGKKKRKDKQQNNKESSPDTTETAEAPSDYPVGESFEQ